LPLTRPGSPTELAARALVTNSIEPSKYNPMLPRIVLFINLFMTISFF
jgi:hypothetical protein